MKLGILFVLVLVLGACSSSPDKKEPRTFKKSYEVVDAKNPIIPDWLEDPQHKNGDAQKMRNEHRYYVSSTEDKKNKRLCIRSSQARATALIASEITQLLKDQYTESTQSSGEEGENEVYMSETLANEVMAYLTGVSTISQYWEKRRYSKELGAEEDHVSYTCWSLVRIPVKVLKRAIREAQKKFVADQKDPEVKEKAQKALKDVENKLDKIM